MSLGHDKVDEIKNRLDLVSIIDKDVGLHSKGNGQYAGSVGAAGGSGESLKVDGTRQVWKDFKNNTGGDVIDWKGHHAGYRDTRGADFPDVLKIAAETAGVELEEFTDAQKEAAQEKADIHNLFTEAAEKYHQNLHEKPGIYDYIFQKWGISAETVDRLKIGYAEKGRNLLDLYELHPTTLKKTGLVYVNSGKMGGEVFQGRIIFPYWRNGKVVYLIGRATDETPKRKDGSEPPKYQKLLVNKEDRNYVSPAVQNSYFYGEDSLRGQDYGIITEGVADCIVMLQAGFPCVSPVTVRFRQEDHVKLISLTQKLNRVYICNDAEDNEAGLKGAIATAEALEEAGTEARLIALPKPEGVDKIDIAEYMKDHRAEDFRILIDESLRLWDYKLQQVTIDKKAPTLAKLKEFKTFISNDLHHMAPDEWKLFVKNDVRQKFGFRMSDIRQALTEVYAKIWGKKDESGQAGQIISKFDLDSASGRGEAYRTMTECFLKSFSPVITFADNGEMRIFTDGVYSDLEGAAESRITDYITESLAFEKYQTCISPSHSDNVIRKIRAKTCVMRSEVDSDPYKIAVKNGILNVCTLELTPFSPEEYFLSNIDIEYDKKIQPCQDWLNYLETTFKGVEWQIPVMQELFGYCLYRVYPYEFLIFLTGDGRNGKGVLFQVLGALVGKHNISSIPLDEIVRKQSDFTLCDLYGKMVNLCGEIGKTKISETRDIKLLTGKDDIRARFPYQKSFLFRNYAKMFFSMNEPPEIEDFTAGLKNRIKIYEFPNTFLTGQNAIDDLEERLITPEALTGLLNWSLEGLHRLLKNKGKLSDTRSASQMGVIYEKKSRPMYYFVRDCIEEDETGLVVRERLEEAYTKYAKNDNLPSLSKEKIREKLLKECDAVGIKVTLKQIRKAQLKDEDAKSDNVAARPRVYTGIKIMDFVPEERQERINNYPGDAGQGSEFFQLIQQVRREMKLFANSKYNGVTPDIEAFVTAFIRDHPGYKVKPGRVAMEDIARKASAWGWAK